MAVWKAGTQWVRQLGDGNYYRYPNYIGCNLDTVCDLFITDDQSNLG